MQRLWSTFSKEQKNSGVSWGDYVKLNRGLAFILFNKLSFYCIMRKFIIIHSLDWECELAAQRACFHVVTVVYSGFWGFLNM